METVEPELGLFTYESYLKAFKHWAENFQSSTPNTSEALVEFTRLNWARTQRLHKTISLDPELKKGVWKIRHTYTWIIITEAWCGDSAQILPVIAEIARLNPEKIKLYILLRDENPELMDNYLTNGARAIPKLLAVDETLGKEAFVWGPRPAPAQELFNIWKKDPAGKSRDAFEEELHTWYARDKTKTLQSEFIHLLQRMS